MKKVQIFPEQKTTTITQSSLWIKKQRKIKTKQKESKWEISWTKYNNNNNTIIPSRKKKNK